MNPYLFDVASGKRGGRCCAVTGLLLAALCLGLSGCKTAPETPQECAKTDWGRQGAQAVARGEPLTSAWQRTSKNCQTLGVPTDQPAFNARWQAGLAGYCTPRNALALGRSGDGYQGICPKDAAANATPQGDSTFRAAHDLGRVLRSADEDVAGVERQIREAENVLRDEKKGESDKRIATARLRALPTALQEALSRRSQLEAQAAQNSWGIGR